MRKIYLLLFLCLPTFLAAQINSGGKEFYLSLGLIGDWGNTTFQIASKHNATVTFYYTEDGSSDTYTIPANDAIFIAVSDGDEDKFSAESIATIEDQSLYIFSDSDIVVTFAGLAGVDEDAMLLYPLSCQPQQDTTHFYPAGAGTTITQNGFTIISHCDSLAVTITPVADAGSYTAGIPFDIVMDKGETFWLSNEDYADESGSHIMAAYPGCNDPLSVYATYSGGYVGLPWNADPFPCCSDKMLEQVLPVAWWDTLYHFVPFYGTYKDAIVRFVSATDNNNIYFDGGLVKTIDEGGLFDTLLTEPLIITADRPVGVNQFMLSWDIIDSGPTDGDPDQLCLNPIKMGIHESIFKSFLTWSDTLILSSVTLITRAGTTNVLLDGTDISSGFTPFAGDPQYVYQQLEVDETTTHTLIAEEPVIAYYVAAYHQGSLSYALGDLIVTPTMIRDTITGANDTVYMCGADKIALHANDANEYLWSTGAGSASIEVTEPGGYTVYESRFLEDCFKDIIVHTFWVDDSWFEFDLGKDTVICDNEPLLLQAGIDADTYRWQDGSAAATSYADKSGRYWVTIDKDHCISSDTIEVTFIDLRQSLGDDVTICRGEPFALTLQAIMVPGAAVLWNTGATSPTIPVTDTGAYIVEVVYPPCTGTDTMMIFSEMCHCEASMPTAFSPNNDGINDIFSPRFEEDCPVAGYAFSIFNRWGQRVFYSSDQRKGWDGTFNNSPCDIGTYFYYLKLKTGSKQDEKVFKGDMTLLR